MDIVYTKHLLTKEEEMQLAQKGDIDSLVEHNLRLVISTASKFGCYGMDQEDLIQEGNIGLLTAARKFVCHFARGRQKWLHSGYIAQCKNTTNRPVDYCEA